VVATKPPGLVRRDTETTLRSSSFKKEQDLLGLQEGIKQAKDANDKKEADRLKGEVTKLEDELKDLKEKRQDLKAFKDKERKKWEKAQKAKEEGSDRKRRRTGTEGEADSLILEGEEEDSKTEELK
jgi:hypothetical protein